MKSFFTRRQDSTPTGHSKSASKESHKFWNPNSNPQEDAAKQRPLRGDETPQYITPQPQQRSSTRPIKTSTHHGAPANTYGEGASTEPAKHPTFRPIASMTAPQNDHPQFLVPSRATSTRYGEYQDKPHPPRPPVTGVPPYTNTSRSTHTPNNAPMKSSRHASKNDPSSSTPHEVWIPSHAPSTSRQPLDDRDPSQAHDSQPIHQTRQLERTTAVDSSRRDREQDRTRDNNRDHVRDGEKERTRRRPQDRDVDQNKEWRRHEQERLRNLEGEKDRAKDTRRDLDRTKERERDREYRREEYERDLAQKENDRAKEREKERERQREYDREREREREKEKVAEKELERAKKIERDMAREADKAKERDRREREKERERRRERERERERQRVARDQERAKEAEQAKEAERVKEVEKAKEAEKVKEAERVKEVERVREAEKVKEVERVKEAERLKEIEREQELKDREQERLRAQEAERVHRERLREADKERERERQRERERAAKDQEKVKEAEREQELKDREQERARAREVERLDRERLREADKERERARQRYYERERKARESDADKPRPKTGDRDKDRKKERDTHVKVVANPSTRPQGQVQGPALDERHEAMVGVEAPRAESREQNHQPRREREPRPKDLHRTRDRERDRTRFRAEATDGEQDLRKPLDIDTDRARRKEVSQNGWVSDNHTSRDRKYMKPTLQRGVKEEKEGSDSSARREKAAQMVKEPTQMDPIAANKAFPLRTEQQDGRVAVQTSVPPVSNSFPSVPLTPRHQTWTHPAPHEPKVRDYSVVESSSAIPPAASALRTQMRTHPSSSEAKTGDQIPPQTSISSAAMLPMVPPTPRSQMRTHQPAATLEPMTSGYTEPRVSEALPSSAIPPLVPQMVPSIPRPQMRTYLPVTELNSGDKLASRPPETLPSYAMPQIVPPTPRVQTRTFPPPTEFKTNGMPPRSFDAPATATALSMVPPTPKVQPRTFPPAAEQKFVEDALPSQLPVAALSVPNPASNQEQTELPPRREINRLKIHPRPADQISPVPLTHAISLETSQPLHLSSVIPSSRTNSNQYHAPVQPYSTVPLQRGASTFQSTLFPQLQSAPAGQTTPISLSVNPAHAVNDSQSTPEQQSLSLSMGQRPNQAPFPGPVSSQIPRDAYMPQSQPSSLLQFNHAIQPQASQQSRNISHSNHAKTVEVLSTDIGQVSAHRPTAAEHPTAPPNSTGRPEDSVAAADVRTESMQNIVQETISSFQLGVDDTVAVPGVHQRYATSRPADLIPKLPENVFNATTHDLSQRSRINEVSNDPIVSLVKVDIPRPLNEMHSTVVGISIPPTMHAPAESQDISVPLPPIEYSSEGPLVSQNATERRGQPFMDRGKQSQHSNSQFQTPHPVPHHKTSVDLSSRIQARPVLHHVENVLHSTSKMATPLDDRDYTVELSPAVDKESAQYVKVEDHPSSRRFTFEALQVAPSQPDVISSFNSSSRQAAFKSSPRHSPKAPISQPSHVLEPENLTPPSGSRPGTSTPIYSNNVPKSLRHPGFFPSDSVQPPVAHPLNTDKPDLEMSEKTYPALTWSHRPAVVESRDLIGASLSRPGTSSGFRHDTTARSQPFSNVHQQAEPRPVNDLTAPTPICSARQLGNEKLDRTYQSFDSRPQPQQVHGDAAVDAHNNSRPSTSERRQNDAGTGLLSSSFQMGSRQSSADPRKADQKPTLSRSNEISDGKEYAGINIGAAGLGPPGMSDARKDAIAGGSKNTSNNLLHQDSSKVAEPSLSLQWAESSSSARHPMATTSNPWDRVGAHMQPSSKSNENSPLVKSHSVPSGPVTAQHSFPSGTEEIGRLYTRIHRQEDSRPRVESLRTAPAPEQLVPRVTSVSTRRDNHSIDATRSGHGGQPSALDHVPPLEQPTKDVRQHVSHMQEDQWHKMGAAVTVANDIVQMFPHQEQQAQLVVRQQDNQRTRVDSKPTAPNQPISFDRPAETYERPKASQQDDHRIKVDSQPPMPTSAPTLSQSIKDYDLLRYPGHSSPHGRSDSQNVASNIGLLSSQSTEGTNQGISNIVPSQEIPKPDIARSVPNTQQVPVAVSTSQETPNLPSRLRNPYISSTSVGNSAVQKTSSSDPARDTMQGASASLYIEAARPSIPVPSSGPPDVERQYGQSSTFALQPRTDRQRNGELPVLTTGPSNAPNPSTTEEINFSSLPSLGFFSDAFRTVLKAPREDRMTSKHSPRKDSSSIPPTSSSIAPQPGSATAATGRDPVVHVRQRGVVEFVDHHAPALTGPLIVEQTMDKKEGKAVQLGDEHATPVRREAPVVNIPSRRQLSSQPMLDPPATGSGPQNRDDTLAAKTSGHASSSLPPPSQPTTQMSMAEKLFQSRQASLSGPVLIQTKQAPVQNLHQTREEPSTDEPSYQASSLLGPDQSQLKGSQSTAENILRSRQGLNMVRGPSLSQTISTGTHSTSRQDSSTQLPFRQMTTAPLSSQPKINHPILAELLSSPPAQTHLVIARDTPANNHSQEQDAKGLRVADTDVNRTEQQGEPLVDVKATPSLRPSSTVPQPQMSSKVSDFRGYNKPTSVQPVVSASLTTSILEGPAQTQRATLSSNPPAGYHSTGGPGHTSTSTTNNHLSVRNGVQGTQEGTSSHEKKTRITSSIMPTYASTSQARRGQQTAPDSSPLSDPTLEPKDIRSRHQIQASSTIAQSTPAPPASRHHHTASLPVTLGASVQKSHQKENMPRSATPTQTHYTTASLQIPGISAGQQASRSNVSLPRAPSEETILMTPSSLAQSLMLQPTVSRQSATPSVSSQNARKGIFNMFRRTTAPQQESAQKHEFWHLDPSAQTPDSSPGHSKGRETGNQPQQPARTSPKRMSSVIPPPVRIPAKNDASRRGFHPDVFTPFRLVASRRNRAVSVASLEAQDGTAANTVVGSPTASMHSQAPIHLPPTRDIREATEAWRNQEEALARTREKGNKRRRRPGVVFDVEEEHPDQVKRRPRRIKTRGRSSAKQSGDA